ncbi:hypothetical protein RRG08_060017 [Elysia crispata]|uniref:Uncharacterized protein n=1 Tax=Elysia crispata TaxID=231223 RepID=A0AAE0YEC1_9GAST|nr:hypothetical protein RRG08_060017 [Elysia crispata]
MLQLTAGHHPEIHDRPSDITGISTGDLRRPGHKLVGEAGSEVGRCDRVRNWSVRQGRKLIGETGSEVGRVRSWSVRQEQKLVGETGSQVGRLDRVRSWSVRQEQKLVGETGTEVGRVRSWSVRQEQKLVGETGSQVGRLDRVRSWSVTQGQKLVGETGSQVGRLDRVRSWSVREEQKLVGETGSQVGRKVVGKNSSSHLVKTTQPCLHVVHDDAKLGFRLSVRLKLCWKDPDLCRKQSGSQPIFRRRLGKRFGLRMALRENSGFLSVLDPA